MWTQTVAGEHNNKVGLYLADDPFGVFGSLLSITTEVHAYDTVGQLSQVYGIMGMHFDIGIFGKTIDPFLLQETTDDGKNVHYWVFPIKQLLAAGETITASSAVYMNEMASSSDILSDAAFQTLYDSLLNPEMQSISITDAATGNEVLYAGYAQKVPQGATAYEDIEFAIMFLVQEDILYAF